MSVANKFGQKVFGVGFPKTGTTSLERAHEVLGFKVCRGHWNGPLTNMLATAWARRDLDLIRGVTDGYDAFFDHPWGGTGLFEFLTEWFPDAIFLQSVRDPDSWVRSLVGQCVRAAGTDQDVLAAMWQNQRYGTVTWLREEVGATRVVGEEGLLRDYYVAHNERVVGHLAQVGVRWFQVDLAKGAGWAPLCQVYGVARPQVPFPEVNRAPSGGTGSGVDGGGSNPVGAALARVGQLHQAGRFGEAASLARNILQQVPDLYFCHLVVLDGLRRGWRPPPQVD